MNASRILRESAAIPSRRLPYDPDRDRAAVSHYVGRASRENRGEVVDYSLLPVLTPEPTWARAGRLSLSTAGVCALLFGLVLLVVLLIEGLLSDGLAYLAGVGAVVFCLLAMTPREGDEGDA